MDPKKKFLLFAKTKHFCPVPWNHITVWTDGSVLTCNEGQPFGNINHQDLEDILRSPAITDIKKNILDDKLIDNCKACHSYSTSDEHFDQRNHYIPIFKNSDVNYDDVNEFRLNGINLHWDNTCNLKCIYCNPYQSSQIAAEQKIRFDRVENSNIDKIIKLVSNNQYDFKELYLSGGEPLLVKHNLKLLKAIDNLDIPIRINSNITMAHDQNPIFTELKRFRNVLWTLSAEAREEKFNYIRSGADWNTFLSNLDKIKNLGHGLRINSVFFIMNVTEFFKTLRYFIQEHGIDNITINRLHRHDYLRVCNAPDHLKQQALGELEQILSSGLIKEKSNLYYNIYRCRDELLSDPVDPDGYRSYLDGLDKLRGTNWKNTFPELV